MLCTACEPEAAPLRLVDALVPGSRTPLVSVFSYHGKAKGIVFHMKFHDGRGYAPSIGYAMGDALAATLDNPGAWLFCPVPMTAAQEKERGYNHSALLARAAARWVGAGYDPALLAKLRETQTQHSLPAAQREQNVRGAYAAVRPERVKGRKIVLCDDICTTGATLRDCVRALEEAGASEILCLTFLRTELE